MKKKPELNDFIDQATAHRGDECLFWPFYRNRWGYAQAGEGYQSRLVNRIVCERMHGPPPLGAHAGHTCGRGQEGCVSGGHLEWQTPQQNSDDKNVRGVMARGERQGGSKLTENQVKEIRASLVRYETLSAKYGISIAQISRIKNRKHWVHV
jgi:hypothetical protein